MCDPTTGVGGVLGGVPSDARKERDMENWIVAFILVDLVITAVVVIFVIRARAARDLDAGAGGSFFGELQHCEFVGIPRRVDRWRL